LFDAIASTHNLAPFCGLKAESECLLLNQESAIHDYSTSIDIDTQGGAFREGLDLLSRTVNFFEKLRFY
jgi:hypothetical protein